jgi:hypothetical protein
MVVVVRVMISIDPKAPEQTELGGYVVVCVYGGKLVGIE